MWHRISCSHRHPKRKIVKHDGLAAQRPQIALRIVGNRQEKSGRTSDISEMIKPNTRKFSESNRKNGEIDARDAESKGKKPDHCATRHANSIAANDPSHGEIPK